MASPIPLVPEAGSYQEVIKEPLVELVSEPKVEGEAPQTEEEVGVQPPFLQELTSVDRLLVTRRLRVRGVLFLRGKKNRFFVRTSDQKLLYTVEEDNSWWAGYLFYGLRPLQLRVCSAPGVEVMRILRPYAFTTRLLPCQLQRLQVFAPPGNLVGSVQQVWTAVKPTYCVKTADGNVAFWVNGPRLTLSCFKDVQFHIQRPDGTAIGATCKRWEGVVHALFLAPVTDRFGIAFEKDLTVTEKALLFATSLLLDYMYYDI